MGFATVFRDLGCGGSAGAIGVLVGQPLDLVKVRMQTDTKARYRNAIDCAKSIVAKEGAKGFFRGFEAPLFGQFAVNSFVFAGESFAMRNLEPNLKHGQAPQFHNSILAGSFAGCVQCIPLVPVEVIKCKMQVDMMLKKPRYRSSYHCAIKVLRYEGLFNGLYRGSAITLLREIPSFGLYFTSYDYFSALFWHSLHKL